MEEGMLIACPLRVTEAGRTFSGCNHDGYEPPLEQVV